MAGTARGAVTVEVEGAVEEGALRRAAKAETDDPSPAMEEAAAAIAALAAFTDEETADGEGVIAGTAAGGTEATGTLATGAATFTGAVAATGAEGGLSAAGAEAGAEASAAGGHRGSATTRPRSTGEEKPPITVAAGEGSTVTCTKSFTI